jgi:L-threonylcarbamoyladenylate synthase
MTPATDAPPVDAQVIGRAVEILLRGGIVGFPTETVYGLGGDADDAGAVAAIFHAKGRPLDHPVIVHVADAAAAQAWTRQVPEGARRLMERFWPGPLTLILPRSARARDFITGAQDSVGLRCPAAPWSRALLRAFCAARGDPAAAIAAPSANRYGRISPTCAAHVHEDLGQKPAGPVDLIVDGGPCALGIESTIVDFAAGGARILRPGAIGADEIAALLGSVPPGAGADGPRAPGRVPAHYAPRKPLELVRPEVLLARLRELQPRALGVLAPADLVRAAASIGRTECAVAAQDPAAYAQSLYGRLRELAAGPAERLLVSLPPQDRGWEAIHDRLARAAAGSTLEAQLHAQQRQGQQ